MLNAKVNQLLNNQVQHEFESAYQYLEISNYFEAAGLDGFACWFLKQSREEISHGLKIIHYLLNWGNNLSMQDIHAANRSYQDYVEPLKDALDHEKKITQDINAIVKAAKDNDDYRTLEFIRWFINEQSEEEETAQKLLDSMVRFGLSDEGLFQIDKKAGKRE